MQTTTYPITDVAGINQHLKQDGFVAIKHLLAPMVCEQLQTHIFTCLNRLPSQHGCSAADYFAAVNRWPLATFIDESWQENLLSKLQPVIARQLQLPVKPYELDILYKSPYAKLPTPCHQDIAYAFKRPYLYSTWIALADVATDASPLRFLPGSHQWPIMPAVDFWQPDFVDEFSLSETWQQQAITVPIGRGDALLFSSAIWHGSLAHSIVQPRLALVIRWGAESLSYDHIPAPESVPFGMWNCGEYTEMLLSQGLNKLANKTEDSFLTLLEIWKYLIPQHALPFSCNQQEAVKALEQLRILHEAYVQYQGGDGQGIVHANLWRALLNPLQNYLGK